MKALVLNATNQSIKAVMSGAAATTNPDVVATYADSTSSAFTEAPQTSALNGTTPVIVVSSPGASTRRVIVGLVIFNRDSAAVTIDLNFDDGGTLRRIWHGTLESNESRTLDGTFDANGALKTAASSVSASILTGQVAAANGGTGLNMSASTGVLVVAAGTFSTKTNPSGALVGDTDAQTLTNKKLTDANVTIVDNGDPTKAARFEASGITAGQTRVITLPDQDGVVLLSNQSNFLPNSSFENWERGVNSAPDRWLVTGSGASIAQEVSIVKHGGYSAKLTRAGTDCHFSANIYLFGGSTYMRGRVYTFGAWVYATAGSRVRLRVNDGTTTTYSSYHSGGSSWEFLTCTFTVGNSATSVDVGLAVDTGNTSGYIDAAGVVEGAAMDNYIPHSTPINRVSRWFEVLGRALGQPVGTAGITNLVSASQILNGYWFNTTAALNDAFEFNCSLDSGTYTLSHLGVLANSAGIITWSVDGVDQATTHDWYAASATYNTIKTLTLTVIGNGYHIIRGQCRTKNGSSGGYNWFVTAISITG